MAFEGLNQKLQAIIKKLNNKGKLSEADVKEAMREVRLALLEADVNFLVVKDFIKKTTERAVGQEVLQSLTPGQQVIKIVHEELINLMGKQAARLSFASRPPTVYLLCGLQGAGKTTLAGKLAVHLKGQGRKPMLVAGDIYRPAAIEQLQIVGEKADVPVFEMGTASPVDIAKAAMAQAQKLGRDVVIVDTAGRLHIDEALMDELKAVKAAVPTHQVLLVVDAMTGQDAVNVAQEFDAQLSVDGVILTKLDGDARGGAALSIRAVTARPILFASTGEKLSDLEIFHPERMASRILGMGDMLTLIERAQEAFDEKQARELEQKMMNASFTLEDFLAQFRQMKKMGPMSELIGMMPGLAGKVSQDDIDEKAIDRMEAIICSMTPRERSRPDIINSSRKRRIASGSGVDVRDVNQLLRQFEQSRKMMKQLSGMTRGGKLPRGMKFPFM
ncbi:MAG: signal recognition particle protein [Christensenellales bacterium]|jgi:signal recognition particle subunit SRP54